MPANIAYLRVSSRSQSVEMQRAAIGRVAKARGQRIDRWLEEKRSAKSLTNRPVLAELRELVRLGKVHELYVYRLDRLTRSGIRDTFALIEEFRARCVTITSVADGFATDGPGADVVLAVLAWAAQMERLAIGERIADAHRRIVEAGGKWGRASRIDATLRKKLLVEHASGRSIRTLAMAHHIPRSTIARALSQKPDAIQGPRTRGKRARDRGASR